MNQVTITILPEQESNPALIQKLIKNELLKKNAGTKKVKVTKSFWHKNTSSNRKNMLKMVKW